MDRGDEAHNMLVGFRRYDIPAGAQTIEKDFILKINVLNLGNFQFLEQNVGSLLPGSKIR